MATDLTHCAPQGADDDAREQKRAKRREASKLRMRLVRQRARFIREALFPDDPRRFQRTADLDHRRMVDGQMVPCADPVVRPGDTVNGCYVHARALQTRAYRQALKAQDTVRLQQLEAHRIACLLYDHRRASRGQAPCPQRPPIDRDPEAPQALPAGRGRRQSEEARQRQRPDEPEACTLGNVHYLRPLRPGVRREPIVIEQCRAQLAQMGMARHTPINQALSRARARAVAQAQSGRLTATQLGRCAAELGERMRRRMVPCVLEEFVYIAFEMFAPPGRNLRLRRRYHQEDPGWSAPARNVA